MTVKVTLRAPRTRRSVLMSIPLPEGAPDAETYMLTSVSGSGNPIPAERDPDGKSISFHVPFMKTGEERVFEIKPIKDAKPTPGIKTEEYDEKLEVALAGSPFLTFHHGTVYPKPVINPILTPRGKNMLREPMKAYGEGEHPWQRGLTLMQGAINGIDCWNEARGDRFGWTKQDRMRLAHGPLSLAIHSENTWYAEERPLMTDRRTYRLFDGPRDAAVLDVSITVKASHGDLAIGGTKEAGFLCIRVNPSMNASDSGFMENSYGAADEEGCWSKAAHWVDYYGPVEDETVGFAIFDHPANFRYPTTWHVRGYGLFAPNCWMFKPDHLLKSGEEMTFRWRIVVHAGDTRDADIRERFLDYVDGVRAKWE